MEIKEGSLTFSFSSDYSVIKFDDTSFYRKKFNHLPSGKGVDIIANNSDWFLFIEIKDCRGHESENAWRTSTDNSKISTAPANVDPNSRDSLDIEVAKKIASTITCMYGAWSKKEQIATTSDLLPYWSELNSTSIPTFNKQIRVILYLEGEFGSAARSKKMIMQRLQQSIESKLAWLNCKVFVVDSDTYQHRFFDVT